MKSLHSFFRRLTTSRSGKWATIVVAAIVSTVIMRSCQRPVRVVELKPKTVSTGELLRTNATIKPPPVRPEPPLKTNPPAVPTLPPIRLAVSNAPASRAPQIVLPSRRLIPCRLVNTVDSSSLETPVIALITSEVFWQQHLILPKGTEVHGRAAAQHLRDRVASQGSWTLIWPTGEEMAVNGIALDMDQQGDRWGPTDGSAGLRGSREQANQPEEVKLFLATFLSGMTEPFQERQHTLLGSSLAPTARNSALTGAGAVIDSYAQRLFRAIEAESIFVRVPAGKSFYLYTLDPIVPPQTNHSSLHQTP